MVAAKKKLSQSYSQSGTHIHNTENTAEYSVTYACFLSFFTHVKDTMRIKV